MTQKEERQLYIQRRAAYDKIKNGMEDITYSDCLLAVDYNGQILPSIPLRFYTKDLCIAALKNNYLYKDLIKYIPKTILTKKFADFIIEISGIYLKYLPIDLVNQNLVLKAVKQTINAIKYIPEQYKTDEVYKALFDMTPKVLKYIDNPSLSLCEYAINKSPTAISKIKDASILTAEMYEKAVKWDWKNLKFIPVRRMTKKLCESAFRVSWKAFRFFPNKFKTKELCEIVINNDVSFIEYCPASMLSAEICEKCLKKRGSLLKFVPDNLKTENLCLLAIKQDHNALFFVPQTFLSNNFYIECLKINGAIIQFVPDALKTFEVYKELLNQASFSKTFREWLISDEKYYNYSNNCEYETYKALKEIGTILETSKVDYNVLRQERRLYLRKISESSYDSELNVFIVKEIYFKKICYHEFSKFEDFYLYLDGNLNGVNLTEYDFEGIDESKYILDGAYLCSKILIKQGNYNGDFYNSSIGRFIEDVSLLPVLSNETIEAGLISHAEFYSGKLNSHDRKIFYITDIHLNHRLIEKFPNFATFDEIRFFIEKYVRKMIKTAEEKGYNDYLLIGGDVSFCFDISKIFYLELCKYWRPANIVVILGNHELWDFNRFGERKKQLA